MSALEALGPYLGRLPVELRHQIYGHLVPNALIPVFGSYAPNRIGKSTFFPSGAGHGAIMSVSRTMRNEALTILHDRATFHYQLLLGVWANSSPIFDERDFPPLPPQETVDRFRNVSMVIYNRRDRIDPAHCMHKKIQEADFFAEHALARLAASSRLRGTASITFYECTLNFLTSVLPIFFRAIAQLVRFQRVVIALHQSADADMDGSPLEWPDGGHMLIPVVEHMMDTARQALEPTLGVSICRTVDNGPGSIFERSRCLVFQPQE